MKQTIKKNGISILFFFLFFINTISAQKPYWQQQVNINMSVKLNDTAHIISGAQQIWYINNSPDTLKNIYFNLYANAFKNKNSDYAKQELNMNSTEFYFAERKDLGSISVQNCKVNYVDANFIVDDNNSERATIALSKPLSPKDSILIQLNFETKIPYTFSRLGHVGQQYNITQWYPKPAVYDASGWHLLNYLDQGEFYSDFGNYTVSIKLPVNYKVAATGTLKTESEIEFLNKCATMNSVYNINNTTDAKNIFKTIYYEASQVHDFAWFADKLFLVNKDSVLLKSGKTVHTWAFYRIGEEPLWRYVTKYINQTVQFLSNKVGDYAYDNCTAVSSTLQAGGGMEYPTITVIGPINNNIDLEKVIAHEVGHNWFQGMFGSNERDAPWLDEGINSYYENLYMKQAATNKETNKLGMNFSKKQSNVTIGPQFPKGYDMAYLAYLYTARTHTDQASCSRSEDLTAVNYFADVYCKVPLNFKLLETYLGTQEMDRMMQKYFSIWKFKHPDFASIVNVFNTNEVNNNLNWFWDDVMNSNKKMDMQLYKVHKKWETIGNAEFYKIVVRNKGDIRVAYTISAIKNDSIIHTVPYGGFLGEMDVLFPKMDFDKLQIDAIHVIPEINRENNTWFNKKIFKKIEPIQLNFIGKIENPEKNQLNYLPIIGANSADKILLGIAFYNSLLPNKKLEYTLAPMYSTNFKKIHINGNINYTVYFKKYFQNIKFTIWNKSYGYSTFQGYKTSFNLFQPKITFTFFEKNKIKKTTHKLIFSQYNISIHGSNSDLLDNVFKFKSATIYDRINQIQFLYNDRNILNPKNYNIYIQQRTHDLKIAVEANAKFLYYKKKKYLHGRIFIGKLITNNNFPYLNLSMSSFRGNDDYLMKDLYINRMNNNLSNIWSQQIYTMEGGFRTLSYQAITPVGISRNALGAVNFDIDLPIKLPLNFYASWGYTYDKTKYFKNTYSCYETGLCLSLGKIVQINFPLILSNNFIEQYKNSDLIHDKPLNAYLKRISFNIDFQSLNGIEQIRNFNYF